METLSIIAFFAGLAVWLFGAYLDYTTSANFINTGGREKHKQWRDKQGFFDGKKALTYLGAFTVVLAACGLYLVVAEPAWAYLVGIVAAASGARHVIAGLKNRRAAKESRARQTEALRLIKDATYSLTDAALIHEAFLQPRLKTLLGDTMHEGGRFFYRLFPRISVPSDMPNLWTPQTANDVRTQYDYELQLQPALAEHARKSETEWFK